MIKINVLGGCVSRVSLLDGHQSMHGKYSSMSTTK